MHIQIRAVPSVIALKKVRQNCTVLSGSCGINRSIDAPRTSTSWIRTFATVFVSLLTAPAGMIDFTPSTQANDR